MTLLTLMLTVTVVFLIPTLAIAQTNVGFGPFLIFDDDDGSLGAGWRTVTTYSAPPGYNVVTVLVAKTLY